MTFPSTAHRMRVWFKFGHWSHPVSSVSGGQIHPQAAGQDQERLRIRDFRRRAPSATSGKQRCCHGNMAYLPDSFRAVYFLLIPRGITSKGMGHSFNKKLLAGCITALDGRGALDAKERSCRNAELGGNKAYK